MEISCRCQSETLCVLVVTSRCFEMQTINLVAKNVKQICDHEYASSLANRLTVNTKKQKRKTTKATREK